MINKMIEDSFYAYKEIKEELNNSAEVRWLKKEVKDSLVLYDGSTLEGVELRNSNEEHKAIMTLSDKYKIHDKSLVAVANPKIENIKPRPSFSFKLNFNKLDLSKYNRIRAKIYIESSGYQNFYFHFGFGNPDAFTNHAPSLYPNIVNDVVWEVSHIARDKVEYLTIAPFLMGMPPEAEPSLKVYVLEIKAELVNGEYELGWDLEDRIAYCHSGYYKDAKKIALTQNMKSEHFYLFKDDVEVYKGKPKEEASNFGNFKVLDFSEFTNPGKYKIKVDGVFGGEFVINDNPYLSPIWKSLNFLRLLRCGEDIAGVHSACHLNCRSYDEDGRTVPNFGGWHDAGDVSQFEICTAEMAHALLDLHNNTKDKMLSQRILDEAKVGLNWLLRTRMENGNRALAVTYSIWRSNVLDKDNQTVLTNPVENGPFENFLAAAAEAEAYLAYKDVDKAFASWNLRAAIEDFDFAVSGYKEGIFTKRWGPSIPSQVSGAGVLAASILYKITKDNKYLEVGSKYAKTILACQERDYLGNSKIRGFFYEDEEHKYILSYDHRGHEQSPIQGLAKLYEVASNHKDSKLWLEGLKLYAEYLLETAKYTKPYGIIPANIYILGKINLDHITIPARKDLNEALSELEAQVKAGFKITDDVYLRVFPIAIQRRGYHATLLSKAKAISILSKILNSNELKQLAINQLEWVLGMNPFASSTMYGEGYNYHPLYVAFSKQMVGSLSVGIKTYKELDKPYWPVINNAVYKEIWGHTTGKFLWVLADL